ncbi:unnamed protein product [Diamesa hyperborea]
MKIPTVENFLFCLELRLGGIICGWFGIVTSVLGAIGLILAAIFGRKFISDSFTPVNASQVTRDDGSGIAIFIGAIVGLIFLGIYFYCSWKLLKGTENNDHTQMKPYLIIFAISTIISALSILTLKLAPVLSTIFYVYIWICIYSLYKQIQSAGSSTRQTNYAGKV